MSIAQQVLTTCRQQVWGEAYRSEQEHARSAQLTRKPCSWLGAVNAPCSSTDDTC